MDINILEKRPQFDSLEGLDIEHIFKNIPSPAYIIDEKKLRKNAELLRDLSYRTGAKILLAQKAFSNFDLYPVISDCIAGTEASGLFEARLGKEEMPDGEVHVFCAAYRRDEFDEILKYADHIVFNSPGQLKKFGAYAKSAGKSIGIRINPEFSTQDGHDIYDPCAPGSRLGVTREQWDFLMDSELISMLDGIHFHTLCEQDSDALEATIFEVERKFFDVLLKMKWVNFGGGHHITRPGYDIKRLEKCIKHAQKNWGVDVYIEPGEACALNSGYLLSRVLDITQNKDTNIAIVDMSAACHTPDVLEMPYRPVIYGAGEMGEKQFTYRIGCPTCLAGDVVGDYSFDYKLKEGSIILFGDMAIYSMCKNNTFNGMPLPSIWTIDEKWDIKELVSFGYNDFKMRLGKLK